MQKHNGVRAVRHVPTLGSRMRSTFFTWRSRDMHVSRASRRSARAETREARREVNPENDHRKCAHANDDMLFGSAKLRLKRTRRPAAQGARSCTPERTDLLGRMFHLQIDRSFQPSPLT